MKNITLVVIATIVATNLMYAQASVLDKAKSAASAAGLDVGSVSSGIMNVLSSKLSLTDVQTPKVTKAVTTFLDAKSKILPLLETNKTAYNQKQGSLFSKLKSTLATALLKSQMNKFMGLKPATNDPSNVLSNLFY